MDRLTQVEQFAKELIAEYAPDYSFKWINAIRILGKCSNFKKVISLSKHFVNLNSDDKILDVILHEIAHALTPEDKGHGRAWKAMCLKVGAIPETCKADVTLAQHTWELRCRCGCSKIKRYRKPSEKTIARYVASKCNTKLEIVKVSDLTN